MPGYDGTGPLGQGPRTGGGFGYCPPPSGTPVVTPVYGVGRGGRPWGGGRGRAWGGGRGQWNRGWVPPGFTQPQGMAFSAPNSTWIEQQIQSLSGQIEALKTHLEMLQREEKSLQTPADSTLQK